MAQPREVPFLMRLLVAWVTFYYSIFLDAVAKSVGGLLEANVFTEDGSSASSSHGSNRTAERKRSHEVACLVAIKYLATGMSFVDLSLVFGLSKTLCHMLVDALLMHFPSVFKQQWVHFPTRDDLDEMAEEFGAIKGVPAVVGAIDGTHVHMKGMEGHRQE
ncbi:unnamed protein product [Closterium sp. Naga37s-1]|nr:unnamed protein product [Closterium sp. Naga37s-1]